MSSYSIIGLMSGTSLDGLDIANCKFIHDKNGEWEFTVNQTQTIAYPDDLFQKLQAATKLSTFQLLQLDKSLAHFFSDCILNFLDRHQIGKNTIDAIASHGHTVFHQPELGFTQQIGCGETLSFLTGMKVINDFRQKDVCAGGQGAPLVPIGDQLLFSDNAEAFLNIGGFSNICVPGEPTIAYDICPGNLPLNKISRELGKDYDADGILASEGKCDEQLLQQLNALDFYKRTNPKSLGTEWLEEHFYPLLKTDAAPKNLLRTLVEHIAQQIAHELHQHTVKSVMITGGGAKNAFLIQQLSDKYKGEIIIPDEKIIDFKEAIIFGFLGALYLAKQVNCLSSVTGAKKDVIGGVLHLPN